MYVSTSLTALLLPYDIDDEPTGPFLPSLVIF